jgi:FlaA1/EpsC-like NDP-sugar epimerase
VPVLGPLEAARRLCQKHEVEELLIAMPELAQKRLRQMVEQVQGMNVRFRAIPAMEAVIEGRVTVSQIRDVDIKDLLGREQVNLDEAKIREYLAGQRVLVTGAGGSIGSEICRQVLRFRPARLVLIEQAENNLFEIDRELAVLAPDIARIGYIADICDVARVDHIFDAEQPAVVFHAAAHKHVPMMELNVGEAIKNNIRGTKTVADAARQHGVKRFVMISTDKAVNPTSVMGCTKRIAEMYIQQLRGESVTQFMTVRFGNVLGSSGSVVPIFAKQIAHGGPVTVTDPAMTRFFMTIPEATQLVLQAGVMGEDGDIFVLDMGEPVKITDLAREMITLSGLRPGEDIEIKFTGVRPGEKLYEELSVKGEDMRPTTHEKIYIWRNRQEDWPRVCRLMQELVVAADSTPPEELKKRLREIVPEYAS